MDIVILIVALSALIYGADFLIDESEKIANHFNISPFIIGATLVALGTSLPEMAASVSASLKGSPDLAVSNVIGSTIFNIALVLGVVFLVSKKIELKRDLFEKDSFWTLFPIMLFLLMGLDGSISTFDGIVFLFVMVAYLLFLTKSEDKEEQDLSEEKEKFAWTKTILFLSIGFVFVIVGANYTIESAISIATGFGVDEWLIGLFLIAFGTSLPELTVSVKAALNNQADLAIGSIIGSNVANFTIVLGASSLISPLNVDFNLQFFDIMTALVVTVMFVFITASKMYNKSAGIALLGTLAIFISHNF